MKKLSANVRCVVALFGEMDCPMEFTFATNGECKISDAHLLNCKLVYSTSMTKIAKALSEQNKVTVVWNPRSKVLRIT